MRHSRIGVIALSNGPHVYFLALPPNDGDIVLVDQQRDGGGTARPPDRPLAQTEPQLQKLNAAIAPYVARARQSYPQARARFLAGLPSGQTFFVVARITDSTGKWEQVFIRVKSILDGRVMGTIASQTMLVTSLKNGDPYELAESDLLDWVIAMPDGSEEGNVVGKFLDTYKQQEKLRK